MLNASLLHQRKLRDDRAARERRLGGSRVTALLVASLVAALGPSAGCAASVGDSERAASQVNTEKAAPAIPIIVSVGVAACLEQEWCRGLVISALVVLGKGIAGARAGLVRAVSNWDLLNDKEKQDTANAIEGILPAPAAPDDYDPTDDLEDQYPGSSDLGSWPEDEADQVGLTSSDGPRLYNHLRISMLNALVVLRVCKGTNDEAYNAMHDSLRSLWGSAWFVGEPPRNIAERVTRIFGEQAENLKFCSFVRSLLEELLCRLRDIMAAAFATTGGTVQIIEDWATCD